MLEKEREREISGRSFNWHIMRTPRVCIFCIGNVNNMVATNQIHYLRSVGCLLLSNILGACVYACVYQFLCLFAQSTVNMYPLDTITNEFIHLSINFESLRCVAFASARFFYLFIFHILKSFFFRYLIWSVGTRRRLTAMMTRGQHVESCFSLAALKASECTVQSKGFAFCFVFHFFLRPDVDTMRAVHPKRQNPNEHRR